MSRSKSRPVNSMTRERLVAPVAAGEEEESLVDGKRKRKAGGSSSSISAASAEPESKSTNGGLKSISNSNLRTLSSMSSFASLSHAATNVVVNNAETSSLAGLNRMKPPASMSLNELTAAIRSSLDKTNIATTGITSESESKEGKLGREQLLINCFLVNCEIV